MNIQHNYWVKIDKIPGTTNIPKSFWEFFKEGDNILEVGSGAGRVIDVCLSLKLQTIAIDINKKNLEVLSRNYKNVNAVQIFEHNILNPLPKSIHINGALLLGLLGALENQEERAKALQNLHSSLKNQKLICISEFLINVSDPQLVGRYEEGQRIGFEFGSFPVYNNLGDIIYITHNFTEEEIEKLIHRCNFEIVKKIPSTFASFHGHERKGLSIIARSKI